MSTLRPRQVRGRDSHRSGFWLAAYLCENRRAWGSRILKDNPYSLGLEPSTTQPLSPWVGPVCPPMATRWSCDAGDSRGSSGLFRRPKPRTSRTPQLQVDRAGAWRAVRAAVQFPEVPLPWPRSVQTSAAAQALALASRTPGGLRPCP